MEMLFATLPAILISLAISIILPWIYSQSKKEEAENAVDEEPVEALEAEIVEE